MYNNAACHGGAKLAFSIGKVDIWGCAGSSVNLVPDPLLAQISLASDITGAAFRVNESASQLFANCVSFIKDAPVLPYVYIDWNDRDAPPVPFEFWAQLIKDIENKKGNLIINCFGGHGRTGTALAALAYLTGAVPKGEDTVTWLRTVYCEEAVESSNQMDYLRENKVTELTYTAPAYAGYTTRKYDSYPSEHNFNDAWESCTTCQLYATPREAKKCREAGKPIRCGYCTGESKGGKKRYCDVCTVKLKYFERKRCDKEGVDICDDCNRKFGNGSIHKETYQDERDIPNKRFFDLA